MSGMFASALAFNQPLSGWNMAAVMNLTGMLSGGAGLSTSNYNALLLGWAARSPHHDLVLDAGFSTYNATASAAHNTLTATAG
jgi:hypothetical protein